MAKPAPPPDFNEPVEIEELSVVLVMVRSPVIEQVETIFTAPVKVDEPEIFELPPTNKFLTQARPPKT